MTRYGAIKVLLAVGIPATGFGFIAARQLDSALPPRVVRPAPAPQERLLPLDLRDTTEPPVINAADLPVDVAARKTPAPAAKAAPSPPPAPQVRELLAGPGAHQSSASFVQMWGVQQPDTRVEDTARRSASQLSSRYRKEGEPPQFKGLRVSGASGTEANTP